jgi:hypothetical protein
MATWSSAPSTLLAAACASCVATHTAPESRPLPLAGEPMYKKPRDLPAAAPDASDAAKKLERALVETDAGAILLRALRAAGGWDAWLALGDLDVSSPAGAPPARVVVSPSGAVHVEPPPAAAAAFVALLPFTLGDPAVRLEYLGVEVDHATAEYAEKVRCWRPGAPPGEWHIVSFDRSTWAVRHIVSHETGGKLMLRIVSDLVAVGGIRVPSRCERHELSSMFAHVDREKPQAIEAVSVVTAR